MKWIQSLLFCLCFYTSVTAQQPPTPFWWQRNNLRVIQVNLPDYEARLNTDSLVTNLVYYNANTVIINAGGIMAFYPTKLPFQYINPYMQPGMLGEVVNKCHAKHIKVIVRFDFSRIEESIFKQHPDWCYISPKGQRIRNTNMYAVSINGPYVQEKAFEIIQEVLNMYDVDGIFLNMPGYQVNNPYEGKYYGIDQNDCEKAAFARFSGLTLPVEENRNDSVYNRYIEFKKFTGDAWSEKLYTLVKAKSNNIAICTYTDKYVDIIRHESQSGMPPYWPHTASDNVGNAINSHPDHVISNASIQQINFQSRFNAAEPGEVAIRLWENVANGSGLDLSMMGDMQGYEDERNFETIKRIYGFHKTHEAWYGKYTSVAKVVIVAPGLWPSGEVAQEYRGIQLMLNEAHIPFDIMVDVQVANRAEKMKTYKTIILPDITNLDKKSIDVLKDACHNGSTIVATNRSLINDSLALQELFGAVAKTPVTDGTGNYVDVTNRAIFKRLQLQKIVMWRYNLAEYDMHGADMQLLPVLSKGRPGPPEIVGGHEPTGYYAACLKNYGKGKALLIPANIGRLYYNYGYTEHKNILLDLLKYQDSTVDDIINTNAPERVEMIPKMYVKNTPGNETKKSYDGMLLHCINITGFSGNSFFNPLPVHNLQVSIHVPFKPGKLYTLTNNKPVAFSWKNGKLTAKLDTLNDYECLVMDKD